MANYLQKLLTEGKENIPALLRKLKGQPALEGEVVGDLATIPKKVQLADIEGELVGQKLLEAAPQQKLLASPVLSEVDDVAGSFTPQTKSFMDHVNDLSPKQKAIGAAGLVTAASAPLFYGESDETSEGIQPVVARPSIPVQPKIEAMNKQEVAKSSSTGKRSVVDNALQNLAPEIESSSRQTDTTNNALEEARRKDAEQGLMFGMLKAAQMGGAAIAGTKADTSYADQQLKSPDQFVDRLTADTAIKEKDKELKELAEKRDPNSRISKLMQQTLATLKPGMNVQGLSAAQVEKSFPSLAQAITMQENIASRKETAALNREAMLSAKGEKKEKADTEFAGKHIDTYTKMLYKDYQGVQQAETNAKRAEDVVAQNIAGVTPGAGDIAILYNFIKGLDKNSAVREGEIALSKQARSVLGRLDSEVKRLSGGDILDSGTRQAFAELIRASADAEKLNFVKQKRNAIAAGEQKGIDPDMLDKALFADIPTTKISAKSTTIPSGNKVKITDTTTGKTKTVDSSIAAKILQDPRFQEVR